MPPQEKIGRMKHRSSAHEASAKARLCPNLRANAATVARANTKSIHRKSRGPLRSPGSNWGKVTEGAIVEIVKIELAEAEPGVTLGGENEHDASAGNPAEHASETGPVNPTPPCGAIEIV